MPELILHHYPFSPFAEKIRLILGYKKLHWHSVFIPNMMPKPDVVALTGGHRRTPFLQIGSDIYCDTALIGDVLEQLAPNPSLYPPAQKGVVRIVAHLWRQAQQSRNAQEIADRGAALLDKFVGFTEALNSLGDKLGQAQGAYEQALTRFQGNGGLLRQTEMLRELGVRSAKPVPEGFAKRVEQQSMLLPADPAARSPDLP